MSALGVLAYEDQQFCVNKSCNRWKVGGGEGFDAKKVKAI